jgi:hypothetical protein
MDILTTTTMDRHHLQVPNKRAKRRHRSTRTRRKEKRAHLKSGLKIRSQVHPAVDQMLDEQDAVVVAVDEVPGVPEAVATGALVVASQWEDLATGPICSRTSCLARTPMGRRVRSSLLR